MASHYFILRIDSGLFTLAVRQHPEHIYEPRVFNCFLIYKCYVVSHGLKQSIMFWYQTTAELYFSKFEDSES